MQFKLHFAHYAVIKVGLIYIQMAHNMSNVLMLFTEKNFSSFWRQLQQCQNLVRGFIFNVWFDLNSNWCSDLNFFNMKKKINEDFVLVHLRKEEPGCLGQSLLVLLSWDGLPFGQLHQFGIEQDTEVSIFIYKLFYAYTLLLKSLGSVREKKSIVFFSKDAVNWSKFNVTKW